MLDKFNLASKIDSHIGWSLTLLLLGPYINYMRFQEYFRSIKNITKFYKTVFGRCLVETKSQYFPYPVNIFRHLKLEVVSAIPASNDEQEHTR